MKKIIKHGYKYQTIATCFHCGCQFQYDWSDVIKPYYDMSTSWSYYYVSCPECGAQVFVASLPQEYDTIKITCYTGEDKQYGKSKI